MAKSTHFPNQLFPVIPAHLPTHTPTPQFPVGLPQVRRRGDFTAVRPLAVRNQHVFSPHKTMHAPHGVVDGAGTRATRRTPWGAPPHETAKPGLRASAVRRAPVLAAQRLWQAGAPVCGVTPTTRSRPGVSSQGSDSESSPSSRYTLASAPAALAQSAERLTRNEKVVGSIPTGGSTRSTR